MTGNNQADQNPPAMPYVEALLRLPEVSRLTGRKPRALYKDIAAGVFTRPVALGARAVAWPASEVDEINRARIAGASVAELQALVRALTLKRKTPREEDRRGAGASGMLRRV